MSKFEMLDSFSGNVKESLGTFRKAGGAAGQKTDGVQADRVGRERSRDAYTIEVDRIAPDPDQPRKEFDPDALARLAESIRTRGQLQPIQVRWSADIERFVILMGERRWRATQMAGLKTMACVVREGPLDDGERLSLQLVENCLREDLSAVEQARAFRTLMDREGWTQEKLADELAVSTAAVTKALSLLRLPEAVQRQVEQGGLSPSHAYEIAKLDDSTDQIRLASTVVEQGLTRDDVAKQVRRSSPARKKAVAKKLPPAMVWRLGGYRLEVARKTGVEVAGAMAILEDAMAKLRALMDGESSQEAA